MDAAEQAAAAILADWGGLKNEAGCYNFIKLKCALLPPNSSSSFFLCCCTAMLRYAICE